MKKLIYLYTLLALSLVLGCREKEEINKYTVLVKVSGIPQNKRAEVKVFANEVDFWANRNPIKVGFVNKSDFFFIAKEVLQADNSDYWVLVVCDSLNSYRDGLQTYGFSIPKDYRTSPPDGGTTQHTRQYNAYLSTTPTKLQLRVYSNANSVKGAKVFLYDSEENYNNKNNYEFRLFRDYSFGQENNRHFYVISDEEGITTIMALEPKKYWFRIEKDGKSNANTIITTAGALPDDVNITNILDVGLQ